MALGIGSKAVVLAAVLGIAASGCASTGKPSDATTGALAGGLVGGFTGGAIGRHNGHGATGAVAGAGLGAVIGGLAGAFSDAKRDTYVPRAGTSWEAPPADPGYDLPPVPRPRTVRVVRRTTVVRTVPVVVEPWPTRVVERRYYYIDD